MKTFDKSKFFAELNLNNLPDDKKNQIWQKFAELVSLEVLNQILDELSEKDQEKLFSQLAKNKTEVEKFLTQNPKFAKLTFKAILKLKKTLQKK